MDKSINVENMINMKANENSLFKNVKNFGNMTGVYKKDNMFCT